MPDLPSFETLQVAASAAACAAGRHALDEYDRRGDMDASLDHDIKLALDRECQEVATASLLTRFSGHAVLGEEGRHVAQQAPVEWIVDPIDGTVNFSAGLPHWCSAVAARVEGRIVAGAVYAPQRGELYYATADGPAFCNGEPIRPAAVDHLSEAVIMTSLPGGTDREDPARNLVYDLNRGARKTRLLGSAAMDICFVASGKGHAYLETCIYIWDVAAASLIAERAGLGTLLRPLPGNDQRVHFVCAVPGIFDEVVSVYRRHYP